MKFQLIKRFAPFVLAGIASVGNAQDVSAIIEGVKSQYAPDTRVAVWEISQVSENGMLMLSGKVDDAKAKEALLAELKKNGVQFQENIAVLPDGSVEKPWALVDISVACIRGEARSGAELTSQAIMGTPVRVLEQEGGMSRIQTPDNYIGYVTDSSLYFLTKEEMDDWKQAERRIVTAYQATLYAQPNGDESDVVSDLLLGNLLKYKGESGDFVALELPDGRSGYARKADVADFDEWVQQSFDMALMEKNARRMMGIPYLWGGMSTKMADCSGFVRTVYFSNGVILQRDASQQALTGMKIDCVKWRTDAEPGDLIFIGTKSGRVTHVAMYIGNGKFIHSSGRVKINSMNPDDDDFLDYVYLSMSRIKGQVGTQGIVAVKSHPWYF